ncbi:hypothetical protein SLE2022_072020 [Rubroshorea leprosula]
MGNELNVFSHLQDVGKSLRRAPGQVILRVYVIFIIRCVMFKKRVFHIRRAFLLLCYHHLYRFIHNPRVHNSHPNNPSSACSPESETMDHPHWSASYQNVIQTTFWPVSYQNVTQTTLLRHSVEAPVVLNGVIRTSALWTAHWFQ